MECVLRRIYDLHSENFIIKEFVELQSSTTLSDTDEQKALWKIKFGPDILFISSACSYPSKENWHIALRNCAYLGMSLIDVLHKKEEDRIVSILHRSEFENDTRATYWTSGTDLGGEGNFYWATSGHSLIHTNWALGQPDNYKSNVPGKMESQNCIWIADRRNMFRWDDNFCSMPSYYICRDKSLYKPPLLFTNILNYNNSVKIVSGKNY